MPDVIVDIVVESTDKEHFVVLKADGHEIDRWMFPTQEDAILWSRYATEKAKAALIAKGRG